MPLFPRLFAQNNTNQHRTRRPIPGPVYERSGVFKWLREYFGTKNTPAPAPAPTSTPTSTSTSTSTPTPTPAPTPTPKPNTYVDSLDALNITNRTRVGYLREKGGSADVYDGLLRQDSSTSGEPLRVAIKVFRNYMNSDFSYENLHSIARELKLWTKLDHCNVLQCLGFMEYRGSLALVSEWMENGNLIGYLARETDIDRLPMTMGVVHGLEYLHKEGIIHSDLKGANVLVTTNGVPVLCDFGNSRATRDGVTVTGTDCFHFSINWLAIELLVPYTSDHEGMRHQTMKSDIWALGMVFYEMLTLKKPYYAYNEFVIPILVINGQLPEKPIREECQGDYLDFIWNMCISCWEKDPSNRPTATELSHRLEKEATSRQSMRQYKPVRTLGILTNLLKENPSYLDDKFNLNTLDVTCRLEIGHQLALGGFSDVYEGKLNAATVYHANDHVPTFSGKVGVKVFRMYIQEDGQYEQALFTSFAREFGIWLRLDHQNILPCLGFTEYMNRPALVSEWMENRDIISYLRINSNANVLELAKGVVSGLEYLHGNRVVHSDMKGTNILISSEGIPKLADFGTSRLVEGGLTIQGTSNFKYSRRWTAVELLVRSFEPRECEFHTQESDIWALGMVFYELLTLEVPYHETEERYVQNEITSGCLPKKPEQEECRSEDLNLIWMVCERCWEHNPNDRPKISVIANKLRYPIELKLVREFTRPNPVEFVVSSPITTGLLAISSPDAIVTSSLSGDGVISQCRDFIWNTPGVTCIAWSSDGLHLVSGSDDEMVRTWSTSTRECDLEIKTPVRVYAVAYSPNNKYIVCGGGSSTAFDTLPGYLCVWDVVSRNVAVGPLTGHTNIVSAVAYSPSGDHILSASLDNSIVIWNSANGDRIFGPFAAHSHPIRSISFHPSGKTFATASNDATIAIWDAETFKIVHGYLRGHSSPVTLVQYSPDGKYVLSVSRDGTLRIWDGESGRESSKPLTRDPLGPTTATFSSSGEFIISGDRDGIIKVWRVYGVDGK